MLETSWAGGILTHDNELNEVKLQIEYSKRSICIGKRNPLGDILFIGHGFRCLKLSEAKSYLQNRDSNYQSACRVKNITYTNRRNTQTSRGTPRGRSTGQAPEENGV